MNSMSKMMILFGLIPLAVNNTFVLIQRKSNLTSTISRLIWSKTLQLRLILVRSKKKKKANIIGHHMLVMKSAPGMTLSSIIELLMAFHFNLCLSIHRLIRKRIGPTRRLNSTQKVYNLTKSTRLIQLWKSFICKEIPCSSMISFSFHGCKVSSTTMIKLEILRPAFTMNITVINTIRLSSISRNIRNKNSRFGRSKISTIT